MRQFMWPCDCKGYPNCMAMLYSTMEQRAILPEDFPIAVVLVLLGWYCHPTSIPYLEESSRAWPSCLCLLKSPCWGMLNFICQKPKRISATVANNAHGDIIHNRMFVRHSANKNVAQSRLITEHIPGVTIGRIVGKPSAEAWATTDTPRHLKAIIDDARFIGPRPAAMEHDCLATLPIVLLVNIRILQADAIDDLTCPVHGSKKVSCHCLILVATMFDMMINCVASESRASFQRLLSAIAPLPATWNTEHKQMMTTNSTLAIGHHHPILQKLVH